MKKIIKDNRGFTIIETLIALSFFAIAMLGAAALYAKSSQNNASSNVVSSANFLAKTTLESFKNMSFDDITPGTQTQTDINENGEYGEPDSIFTRMVVIADIDDPKARQIEITITWPNNKWANGQAGRIVLTSNVRGSGL